LADRFYGPEPPRDGVIVLSEDESRHLARVSRRVEGETVEVFDGRGGGFLATITRIGKSGVELTVQSALDDRATPLDLTLLVAAPKGDRLDWLVEKATEIGVTRLIPIRADRSVVDPRSAKLDRLRRTIIEASKQCGRNRLMTLDDPMSSRDAFRMVPAANRWIAHAGGNTLQTEAKQATHAKAALAVGPEGGWTEDEINQARQEGWAILGLGKTRLRVETAALVGSVILINQAGGPRS
jgi:16S rRNA (uracil1498-N3)-methyltransferase